MIFESNLEVQLETCRFQNPSTTYMNLIILYSNILVIIYLLFWSGLDEPLQT